MATLRDATTTGLTLYAVAFTLRRAGAGEILTQSVQLVRTGTRPMGRAALLRAARAELARLWAADPPEGGPGAWRQQQVHATTTVLEPVTEDCACEATTK